MGWSLNSWWLVLGTSISHQSLRPNERIWFWLTMLSLTQPTRKRVSKRRRHGRNGSEHVRQIWSDLITIFTWMVPLSGCRLPSSMWTPNLNMLLGRTMTLSPSKQRSTNFVPTKSIVIYLAPMLVLKIITSWTRFDLAYNRAADIWTSHTGLHERRSTFGISRNRQDVRLLSSHIVCHGNLFFLSFISDVTSQLLLCKGDMTLSALCVSKKSAFVHERSLRQFLLEDYYGLRFEEGQLLVRYCSSGCWLDEIWQVFPEITLHIVPDAGHSSSEPGIEKLLVEVCKLDCTFWNTHSLMYIFL